MAHGRLTRVEEQPSEGKRAFSTDGAGAAGHRGQGDKPRPNLPHYTSANSRGTTDLDCTTIRLSGENQRKYSGPRSELLDLARSTIHKRKNTDARDCVRVERSRSAAASVKRVGRKATHRESEHVCRPRFPPRIGVQSINP